MAIDIHGIAQKLNILAQTHPIGQLQHIRTELKSLKRRPGNKIFSMHTIFDTYAFHHGGRTELQYNIGNAGDNRNENLRYGVAFSFETNQTLKSIDVLIPKVKLFNDFISMNADDFSDMRMWHYDPQRSLDYLPGPISSTLVKKGIFVFLGNRQPIKNIDYETILDDFDRLLSLYKYVESGGSTQPEPFPKNRFDFKPGYNTKAKTAKGTHSKKELDFDLRHNKLQEVLYRELVLNYGKENVGTEQPSGVGTQIDAVVKRKREYWFYEIKTSLIPRACLREAIGQLLEYGLWPGAQEPSRYIVVGETPIDRDGKEYLRRLNKKFSLPIEYERIVI